MENKETLGKRIAELRKRKGMTQEQLGEKVGVSAQAVSKWENDLSYPDITLLPVLSDLLGASVDELMGVKPIDPKVIILDKEEKTDEGKAKWNWEWNVGRWPTIASCIGLIMICMVFLLHGMFHLFPYGDFGELKLNGWGYVWPLLIFTLGLSSINSSLTVSIVLMALGGYEFIRRVIYPYGTHLIGIPWYVILLVFAIAVLIKTIIRNVRPHDYYDRHKKGKTPVMEMSTENDYLDLDMSFGSGEVIYDREVFTGGTVDSSFGDYTIDLTGVKTFTSGCVLEVDESFGNLTILLPRHVKLVKSSENNFAAFSVTGEPDLDVAQQIIVKSEVSFGSLQVVYR